MMFWQTFIAALLAATFALTGNAVMLTLQNRAKVREESRAFVRQLHNETVDAVADMDLLMREIRASVIAGIDQGKVDKLRSIIKDKWEGDLLRRVRRVRFGHPDPDVQAAAEQIEDDFWPYLAVAERVDDGSIPFLRPLTLEDRAATSEAMENAIVEFRRAVYHAPIRKRPKKARYDGRNRPSRLARAQAARAAATASKAAKG